jgi:hypothetical protein
MVLSFDVLTDVPGYCFAHRFGIACSMTEGETRTAVGSALKVKRDALFP